MKNKEKALLGIACFLGGVVAGFLLAPIKQGIYCGNNNGNYLGKNEELNDVDELEENPEENSDL
ncbi:MAG: hypothetical protein E7212_06590 [Clostridium sartagoforme]|nr:hypothetical protein [Clostridium sartagoforme]